MAFLLSFESHSCTHGTYNYCHMFIKRKIQASYLKVIKETFLENCTQSDNCFLISKHINRNPKHYGFFKTFPVDY